MFEGFKKFIARGNMIDMAVGVVMGGAVHHRGQFDREQRDPTRSSP